MHTSIAGSFSSRQMMDNIFDIETPLLWPIFRSSARIRYLVDGLRCCLRQRQSLLDPLRFRENQSCLVFICSFLRSKYNDSTTYVEFAGATRGQFLMARGVRQGCPTSGFLFPMQWHSTSSSDGSKKQLSQRILITWTYCDLRNVLVPTT